MKGNRQSVWKLLAGDWNAYTIVTVLVGAVLFGVLMNYGSIVVFTNTFVTLAMILDVIVGALFGPLPAALMAFLGNVFSDFIAQWGFWFDWSIGNAVLAFFVGLFPFYGARVKEGVFTAAHAVIFAITSVVGNLVAFGVVTPLLTYALYSQELLITWSQAWNAVLGNAGIQIVIGVPLLFLMARMVTLQKEEESPR